MKRDDGFTLIEVLTATALTMIVLGLTLQAFRGALDSRDAVSRMSETNANLQTALTRITDDLAKAGQNLPPGAVALPYVSATQTTPATWPIPGSPGMPYRQQLYVVTPGDELGPRVSETSAGSARSDVISLLTVDPSIVSLPIASTDVTDDESSVVVHYDPDDPDNPGVQINDDATNRIAVGDLFALVSARGTVLQEVTDAAAGNDPQRIVFRRGADSMALNQPAIPQGTILALTQGGGSVSEAIRVQLVTYYLDRTTPEQPMLMRRVNGRPPSPVAVGIEQFQISYDLFRTGASFLNVPAPTGVQRPSDIRKVRIFIGARSEDRTVRGEYYRNTVTTQVTVRSLGVFDRYK